MKKQKEPSVLLGNTTSRSNITLSNPSITSALEQRKIQTLVPALRSKGADIDGGRPVSTGFLSVTPG